MVGACRARQERRVPRQAGGQTIGQTRGDIAPGKEETSLPLRVRHGDGG